jgi:hypothetical protein
MFCNEACALRYYVIVLAIFVLILHQKVNKCLPSSIRRVPVSESRYN